MWSRFLITCFISCVIQGKDDLPRISFVGMNREENWSIAVVNSFHRSSTDLPKCSFKNLSLNSAIKYLRNAVEE